jgi:hypothetical protein
VNKTPPLFFEQKTLFAEIAMNRLCTTLAAGLFSLSVSAWAQTSVPAKPDTHNVPAPSVKAPSNSGVVVVPPKTGTEEMVTKPKNVDPEMGSATDDIDRKNQKENQKESGKKSGDRK